MPQPLRRFAPLACLLAIGLVGSTLARNARAQSFEDEQREYARVEAAFQAYEPGLESLFQERGLTWPPREVFLRVIKRDRVIEVWARNDLETPFTWVRNVDICFVSGEVGPKRQQGDHQHPEGFYTIDRFNPVSRYLLSLRVGYPNRSDRILSDAEDLGGDIYIHGGCGSTGCLAVGDEATAQLYVIAVAARDSGQEEIPIHTFPIRFHEADDVAWLRAAVSDPAMWAFWDNLRAGYDYFETNHLVPTIRVDDEGRYEVVDETR